MGLLKHIVYGSLVGGTLILNSSISKMDSGVNCMDSGAIYTSIHNSNCKNWGGGGIKGELD